MSEASENMDSAVTVTEVDGEVVIDITAKATVKIDRKIIAEGMAGGIGYSELGKMVVERMEVDLQLDRESGEGFVASIAKKLEEHLAAPQEAQNAT